MEKKYNRKEKQMVSAWKEAAEELDIMVQSPFTLNLEDGTKVEFLLLIEHFGSKLGTLIITLDNFDAFDLPEQYGYYCSALNLDSYKKYDSASFKDTLEDWRYFGDPQKKPKWYEGIYEE